ncbi:initiation-specific alpha-1,6-mannosyltransferase Ecym_1409 [Eremothecium cymbalariae DBVPG|uniref:Initiation-specific alpha-1,6-mannosyltransferase n=1 Tax=Eremothecium cymbalariae (strain CBS 270.75 / DBVPG 7215 / KCTC 17166 / NRRL Y-17582) TaxID=931890 RepID=G8JM66_ERECY|nr:hypothetical protein Ecym_1409 [Eremothecium cymbalariae DBVPG\
MGRISAPLMLPTTSHSDNLNLKKFLQDDFEANDLRSQLAALFPYDSKTKIPKRIWQTWRDPVNSPKFPEASLHHVEEWKKRAAEIVGEEYDYFFISDDEIMPLLKQLYGTVPYVIQAFMSMPEPILKADFFRYLILYAKGGIYSDIDTYPLKPFNEWFFLSPAGLKDYMNKKIGYGPAGNQNGQGSTFEPGLVIGIEADPDRSDWADHYARRIQFCQWTFQSKPGHPILRELIVNITATTLHSTDKLISDIKLPLHTIEKSHQVDYNVNYRHKKMHSLDFDVEAKKTSENTDGTDVMNWTGPGIFSDIIFEYFDNLLRTNDNIALYNDNLLEEDPKTGAKNNVESTTHKFYKQISTSIISATPKLHWSFFSLIQHPVIVDDVVILPITCFSPGIDHMGSRNDDDPMAFVKHLFEGSWKSPGQEVLGG